MDNTQENTLDLYGDEEIIEVIDLNEMEPDPDDLADDLDDVDFEDAPDDDEGWETDNEMEEDEDDSELTFSKHTGSVFCVSLDPATNSMAVTGGEDDKAYVWRVSDGAVLLECTGHKDSVTCAVFSHDSSMVATGDMSGMIKVWKVETKEEVWSFEVGDLEWLEWHPCAPVLLAGSDDGNVWMWKIPSGECKTFQSSACQATSGKVLPDGKRAAVGYEDGTVRVWDLKQGNAAHIIKGRDAHKGALTCLACNKDGSLVLTGSVDGFAKLVNTATGKVGVRKDGGGSADTLSRCCFYKCSNLCVCVLVVSLACEGGRSVLAGWRQSQRAGRGGRNQLCRVCGILQHPASRCCGVPGRDSRHIRPRHAGPEAQVPPRGWHRSPAVGGVFFCGVHLLLRRSAAPVGRPFWRHCVRVPRPHCRDPQLHHQQGGVFRNNRVRRQPGEGLLPPETRPVKRAARRSEEIQQRHFTNRLLVLQHSRTCFPSPSGF